MNIEGATVDESADYKDTSNLIGRRSDRTGLTGLKDKFFYSIIARLIYVIILCIAIGFIGPFIINKYLAFSETVIIVQGTCHIQYGVRVNCFPEYPDHHNVSKEECDSRGCCFQKLNLATNAPVCHRKLPSVHTLESSGNEFDGKLTPTNLSRTWPDQTLLDLKYSVRQMNKGHVSVIFYDDKHRPDINLGNNTNITDIEEIKMTHDGTKDLRLAVRMWRKANTTSFPLLDASFGSVFITDRYSEISLSLPSGAIFGLGGHPISFNSTESRLSANFTKKLFFNYDPDIFSTQQHNLPFFMFVDSERNFAGMFVETGGFPTEVEVLPGRDQLLGEDYLTTYPLDRKPLLVFRSMSNFQAIHVFTGPNPKDVLLQLASYIGMPDMPQLWSLGLHMCRKTQSDSEDFNYNLKLMADNFIPFDSDCLSENILRSSFDTSNVVQLPEDLINLNSNGKKFLLKSPPHTENIPSFTTNGDFIINKFNNDTFKSEYGTLKDVVLPDFTNPNVSSWFGANLNNLMQKFPIKPSGFVPIKNSPFVKALVECDDDKNFQFVPVGAFAEGPTGLATVCPNSKHFSASHFAIHNDYPLQHEKVIEESLTSLKISAMIFSTHSHPKSSKATFGSHFDPNWDSLKLSLKEVLELGLSGTQFVSMEACGYDSKNTVATLADVEELCLRWYQLAAFMPGLHTLRGTEGVSRLPYSFEKQTYTTWTKRALQKRIKLSPYYYAQMFKGSFQTALPLVRPLFMEFPDDQKLVYNFIVKDQFMVGDALLVNPVLEPGITLLTSYFPQETFYELWSGLKIQGGGTLEKREVILPETPTYIRRGMILPMLSFYEEDNPTSTLSSYSLFNHTLVVAFSCQEVGPRAFFENCTAAGELLLHHDGSTVFSPEKFMMIKVDAKQNFANAEVSVSSGSLWSGCSTINNVFIDKIIVYGARAPDESLGLEYDPDLSRLEIDNLDIDACSTEASRLLYSWKLKA